MADTYVDLLGLRSQIDDKNEHIKNLSDDLESLREVRSQTRRGTMTLTSLRNDLDVAKRQLKVPGQSTESRRQQKSRIVTLEKMVQFASDRTITVDKYVSQIARLEKERDQLLDQFERDVQSNLRLGRQESKRTRRARLEPRLQARAARQRAREAEAAQESRAEAESEKTLKRLLKQSKQQGRMLKAEREFHVETVGVSGAHRDFQEIARSVSQGDDTVSTGYQRQMIVAVKSLEAENLPGNVFRDGVKQIIDDILKVVHGDVLIGAEAKREVENVATQLIRYAERRGQVHRRISDSSKRLSKRIYSSFADSLSSKRSILLRGLGYLLKTPERRQERAKIIAETRQAATEGAIGAREQGEYDPELMTQVARRLRGDRREPTSPEGRVLVDIRDGITKLVDASERNEEEYQQRQEFDEARAEEGQEIFKSFSDKSPSKIKTDTDTKNRTQGLIGSLLNLIPGMSSTMKTIETVSGVLGNLAKFLGMGEFGSLAAFFGSAAFATAFAGIIAVGVVGAAWMALLSKWGELVGLRKKYKEEGNRKLAQSEIAQLKSEGVDMSFAENAATTGEMARAVANTRLTQGSITPEEWKKLKERGVIPPKSGQGFTDEDALKYLEVRKELANEKLTGKSGALGTLQANMQVALGGEVVYTAERKRTMRRVPSAGFSPSTVLPTYDATASGFVEGGEADIHEALPEGRARASIDFTSLRTTPSRIDGREKNTDASGRFETPDEFVRTMYPYALQASTALGGIDPTALLSQWGLESGWGKSVSGNYNYFGIKADRSWKGDRKNVSTHEVENGATKTKVDAFRSYKDIGEAVGDYVAFIKGNKRYKKAGVFEAKTAEEYFSALQTAGYATDPNYAMKMTAQLPYTAKRVSSVMGQIPSIRQGSTLAQASTGLEDQRTSANMILMAQAPSVVAPPQTAPPMIPYAVRPRDDSRDAFNRANAF